MKSSPSIWHLPGKGQIDREDFVNFCGLLKKYELYFIFSYEFLLTNNHTNLLVNNNFLFIIRIQCINLLHNHNKPFIGLLSRNVFMLKKVLAISIN